MSWRNPDNALILGLATYWPALNHFLFSHFSGNTVTLISGNAGLREVEPVLKNHQSPRSIEPTTIKGSVRSNAILAPSRSKLVHVKPRDKAVDDGQRPVSVERHLQISNARSFVRSSHLSGSSV